MADHGGAPDSVRDEALRAGLMRAIRRHAPWMLIAGLVCLYFGSTLPLSAPASAQGDEVQRWWAADRAAYRGLQGVGGAFIVVAALMFAGLRASLLAGMFVEAAFAVVVAVISVLWTLRARADGAWDMSVLILVVLFMLAIMNAREMLREYRASSGVAPGGEGAPPE